MPSKKNKDLTAMSAAQLSDEAARLRKELFDLQFKHSTRQLADLMAVRNTRRHLARVLTHVGQKASA